MTTARQWRSRRCVGINVVSWTLLSFTEITSEETSYITETTSCLKTKQTKWHNLPPQNHGQKSCECQLCITVTASPQSSHEYKIVKVETNLLTLYHTISTFNILIKEAFLKRCGKRLTSTFSFSHNVFYSSEIKFQFLDRINFAICKYFQFGLSTISLFGKELTLYHTIPTFNDPEREGFWKHCGKRRKCW